MNRFNIIFIRLVVVFLFNQAISQETAYKSMVFSLDEKVLFSNREKIKSGDAFLKPAFQKLIRDAESGLQLEPMSVVSKSMAPPSGDKHDYMSLAPYHWPDPAKKDGLPYIRKDGQTNPEGKQYKDKEYLPLLCESVITLSLAYYFTGEEKYADKASTLIRVWFLSPATKMNPNLNFGQAIKGVTDGRGAGLIETRHLLKVTDAIGLLQGASVWKTSDQQGMKDWFSSFLEWMQTSKNGLHEMNTKNNHGVWYDAQRLSFALFTGQHDLAKRIVSNLQFRLDTQMDNNGFFPAELSRTLSLHYSVFVLDPFFTISQMATHCDVDLWSYTSPSGKSLKRGFYALLPFLLQDKAWEGPQIKPFNFKDAAPILAAGKTHYDCVRCLEGIERSSGQDFKKLRIHLFL